LARHIVTPRYEPDEIRYGCYTIALSMAYGLAMIPNDVRYIAHSRTLAMVIILRFVAFLFFGTVILLIRRRPYGLVYESIVALAEGWYVVATIVVAATRPLSATYAFVPSLLLIVFLYFAIPAVIVTKVTLSLALSAWELYRCLVMITLPEAARLVIALTFICLNVAGIQNALLVRRLRSVEMAYRGRLEDELRFKRAIAATSYEAIFLCEGERVVEVNRACTEILGFDVRANDAVPRTVGELFQFETGSEEAFRSGEAARAVLRAAEGEVPVEAVRREVEVDGRRFSAILVMESASFPVPVSLSADATESERLRAHLACLPISRRERQIVECILAGWPRHQIARELCISDETVKKHTANIYRKLGIGSKMQLVRLLLDGS